MLAAALFRLPRPPCMWCAPWWHMLASLSCAMLTVSSGESETASGWASAPCGRHLGWCQEGMQAVHVTHNQSDKRGLPSHCKRCSHSVLQVPLTLAIIISYLGLRVCNYCDGTHRLGPQDGRDVKVLRCISCAQVESNRGQLVHVCAAAVHHPEPRRRFRDTRYPLRATPATQHDVISAAALLFVL